MERSAMKGEAVFLGLLSRAEEAEEKAKVYRTLAEILAEHPDVEFIARAVKDPAVVRVIFVIYSLYEAGQFELAREVLEFFEGLVG